MPRMNAPDANYPVWKHKFKWAKINKIYTEDDTADIEIIDKDQNPTGEVYSKVPIFYHCEPDAKKRTNGALEGAHFAFSEQDKVIVKIEDENLLIVARKDGLGICNLPLLISFFVKDGKSYAWVKDKNKVGIYTTENFKETGLNLDEWEWFFQNAGNIERISSTRYIKNTLVNVSYWGYDYINRKNILKSRVYLYKNKHLKLVMDSSADTLECSVTTSLSEDESKVYIAFIYDLYDVPFTPSAYYEMFEVEADTNRIINSRAGYAESQTAGFIDRNGIFYFSGKKITFSNIEDWDTDDRCIERSYVTNSDGMLIYEENSYRIIEDNINSVDFGCVIKKGRYIGKRTRENGEEVYCYERTTIVKCCGITKEYKEIHYSMEPYFENGIHPTMLSYSHPKIETGRSLKGFYLNNRLYTRDDKLRAIYENFDNVFIVGYCVNSPCLCVGLTQGEYNVVTAYNIIFNENDITDEIYEGYDIFDFKFIVLHE